MSNINERLDNLKLEIQNSCNPLVKEEKRACLYSVRPLESVIPIQA